MFNKTFWYRKGARTTGYILQGLLAGLIVLCLLGLMQWTEGDFSLTEMGRSFESTGVFLRAVEDVIREKVSNSQNIDLFEDGGSYAPEKRIDIRQYMSGSLDQTSQNPGTSYTIENLLIFAEEGAKTMQSAVTQALSEGTNEEAAGEALARQASQLETILPVSGVYLADYSRVSSNASLALVDYYRSLCETALDVAKRYEAYSLYQDGELQEASEQAPGNILYYVENTSTRQRYTNMDARSLTQAEDVIDSDPEMVYLFEGERSYNIMVVNTDNVLNNQASEWFSRDTLVGSNERILIAVNLSFPVGDSIQSVYLDYQKREPLMLIGLIAGSISVIVLLFLLTESTMAAGHAEGGGSGSDEIVLHPFDNVPTEIAAGLCLIIAIIWGLLALRLMRRIHPDGGLVQMLLLEPAVCMIEYWILLFSWLSMVRRLKAHTLWKNSVIYYVVMGSRQVISARKGSQRLLLLYGGFVILNLLFLMLGGIAGAVMALTLNMAALLYLMRDVVGNQNVREGLQQIQAGHLDYRVNTEVLYGESKDLGQAVNEMGDGLQHSIDTMLKSERMKAELITNVSHDLKTPLTSIINYVDLLKRAPAGSEQSREYLDILEHKTQRLKKLTEDLIEVSKISSGSIELHQIRLGLRSFVMQAVGECEDSFEETGLTPCLSLGEEEMVIEADGEQLWRVFENLLGNIVKYAKSGTSVFIVLREEEDAAVVSFENEPAIPITASAEQLLERFSRGDESRTTEGSGLGLSIAKSLTELMGGSFFLEVSENRYLVTLRFPIVGS